MFTVSFAMLIYACKTIHGNKQLIDFNVFLLDLVSVEKMTEQT